MSFKDYLKESPVGVVGRTGKYDAEVHVTPGLEKEFMDIIKKIGGKTVARLLINKMDSQGGKVSPDGDDTLTKNED